MNKEFIEEIILELSYRVSGGIPDLTDDNQLLVLREIMQEKGLSYEEIENVMSNLRGNKRLLVEFPEPSFGGSTRSFAIDFDGTHSSGSLSHDFRNYDPEIKEPVQDDEAEAEDDGDEPVKEESYVPTYIFDPEKMGIVETGGFCIKSDVLSENKFKCFMTGEVFLETKNGTLVKELDYLDSEIEDEDNINEIEFSDKADFEKYNSQHKMRDTTVVTIGGKETTAGEVGKPTEKKPKQIAVKMGTKGEDEAERPGVYSQKSEVSKGLFSAEIKNINGVEVRQLVDESGKVVDVSTSEGRKKAISIVDDRIKSHGDKIKDATLFLADKDALTKFTKESGESGTLIMKWLGEVGELQVYKDFLGLGKQAYMLTDSAPKNDMVVLTDSGQEREIGMSYISIKTVKGGQQENGLGANCKSEYEKFLSKAEIKDMSIDVGGEKVNVGADPYVASTINVRSEFLNVFSEAAGVCRDGVRFNKDDADSYLPGYEKTIKKDKLTGNEVFVNDADFMRHKRITKDDVEKIFSSPATNKRFKTLGESKISSSEAEKIKANFKQQLLDGIEKSGNKFTLRDLESWENNNIGTALNDTKAKISATSDTGVAYFYEGKPNLDVNIVPAESVNVEYRKKQQDIYNIKDPVERADKLVKLTGLSQRVRKVGGGKKKNVCQAKLDGIDNTKPMVKSDKHRLSIDQYSKKYLDNK